LNFLDFATASLAVHSTSQHNWGVVTWMDGKTYAAPTCELDVGQYHT
jgi:2-dehydro-3-deoxygluconokinase